MIIVQFLYGAFMGVILSQNPLPLSLAQEK